MQPTVCNRLFATGEQLEPVNSFHPLIPIDRAIMALRSQESTICFHRDTICFAGFPGYPG